MTEDKARAALRAFVAVGGLEQQLAKQRWQADAGGWAVLGALGGWRFRIEPAPTGCACSRRTAGASRRCGPCRREGGRKKAGRWTRP